MNKLALAVKARLPLIAVTAETNVNIEPLLLAAAGEPVQGYVTLKSVSKTHILPGGVYWAWAPHATQWSTEFYAPFALAKATLIVVNPLSTDPCMFDAGPLRPTEEMVREFVKTNAVDSEVEALVTALHGLGHKSMLEISKLAMAASGEFTARSVRRMRLELYGEVGGLRQVDTDDILMYWPHKRLEEWLMLEGKLMTPEAPYRLRPRGLLFSGLPGTGKTLGAKYLARELGLPLYLLDISGMLSKWQGDSEKSLSAALTQAESNSPCVLLLDEAEKLFESGDDSGSPQRLLATLLWWLQEHRSTILTILTTNAQQSLPPELIRAGRVDEAVTFVPAPYDVATKMSRELAEKLTGAKNLPGQVFYPAGKTVTYADITQDVIKAVRKYYLTNAINPAKL